MRNIHGILSVLLIAFSFGCYKESEYGNPLADNAFTLVADKATLPADSFSTAKITVDLPGNAVDSSSKVIFKTSTGIFVESGTKTLTVTATKNAGSTRIAEALLRSGNKTETATISVELFNLKKTIEVKFTNSFPDKLKLTASSLSIKPLNSGAGEVNIDGFITKMQGFASTGNIVDVTGYDEFFTKKLGSFRIYNNQSNEGGKTNYVFVLGDSVANSAPAAYLGILYLEGKVFKNTSNEYTRDTIKLISSR